MHRKNVEAIALDQSIAPRTLQRFLESIVWDQQMLRDRRQQLVAAEHASCDAIGCIDETESTEESASQRERGSDEVPATTQAGTTAQRSSKPSEILPRVSRTNSSKVSHQGDTSWGGSLGDSMGHLLAKDTYGRAC